MIAFGILLFLILFFFVRSQRECMLVDPRPIDYINDASLNDVSRDTRPNYGRLTSIFKYQSPEDWPDVSFNPAFAINVSKRGRVTASPHVPTM